MFAAKAHGTRYRYKQGCRCAECRAANAAASKRYRDRHPDKQAAMVRGMEERRRWLDAVKLASGCVACGYDHHPSALQFHHREDKSFELSAAGLRSYDALRAEIKKCDVLCCNCHSIKTTEGV